LLPGFNKAEAASKLAISHDRVSAIVLRFRDRYRDLQW
jgi:hypothetical protein